MYNNFRPTGSVIQLMDGRVFKRNQKNLWEDINTGVTITEQQLGIMISSASFSSDASGGGRTNKPVRFVADYTPSSVNWGNITGSSTEAQNSNQTFTGINVPITLQLSFGSGTYGATSNLKIYKNNTLIQTIGINARPSATLISETFSSGDTLKFGVLTDTDLAFGITIFNMTEPVPVGLDSFTVTMAQLGG